MTVIDLDKFRSGGARVFAGRDRGREVRAKVLLDEHDLSQETVEIRVPQNVFSVNSSFFLGMFGPSIRKLGEDNFKKKYLFTGRDIRRVVRAGIDEALNTSSPLGKDGR